MFTCVAALVPDHEMSSDTPRRGPGPRPPSPGGTPAWSRERNTRRSNPTVINKVKLTQSPRDTRDQDTISIQDQL